MSHHATASVDSEHQRHEEVASKRQRMKLIVLDPSRQVLFDSIDPSEHELRLLLNDDRTRLRVDVDVVVEALIEHCIRDNVRHSRIAFLDAQRFVRATRLDGRDGIMFAISVEYFRGGDSLARATRKYQLTPREIEVLAMILEGASAAETADALKIAETTVQGYYKRLLSKTGSRNRPAMVANVLDWGGSGRRQTRSPER
jgi:DNA-binding CsgD family transcriptional regulator